VQKKAILVLVNQQQISRGDLSNLLNFVQIKGIPVRSLKGWNAVLIFL